VFAETVFEPADRVKIIGGLRWEEIGLDYTPYPSLVTASTDYTPTTGRVGVVFELTPRTNVYGSYSRAVEPTTQLVSLAGSQQQFSLVPGRQFEFGAKGSALDGRLDGTLAYFDIEKRDLLITSLIDGIRTNQQVGRQSSRGIELAVVGRPFGSLTVSGDVAITDALFDDFVEIVNDENLSRTGNTPPGVPRVLWNLSPSQRIGRLDLTATLRQVGARWGDNANSRRVGSYTTIDAAAGVRFGRGSRITVRGRNLTDRVYTQSTSNTAGRLEPPRAFDVTFTTDF
jgi:iron complex outermembrane receptor protein